MTAERAAAWVTGLERRWPRWALVAAGVGAFAASVAGSPDEPCSALDPTVCGPDLGFSAAVVLALAAVLLLWWWPGVAAACAVAFAVLEVGLDDVVAAQVAWPLLALAHVWHVVVLRREDAARRRVAHEVATPLPRAVVARRGDPGVGLGPRHVAVVALVVASLGCLGALVVRVGAEQAHESRSRDVAATVVGYDDDQLTHRVRLDQAVAGFPSEHDLETFDDYEVGEHVALRIDITDPGWTHLTAEPPDPTWWLTLSLGALLLAGVLGHPLLVGRVQRAVLASTPPTTGVPVRWVEVDDEVVPVLSTDRDVVVAELETVPRPRGAGPEVPRLEHLWRTGWLVGDVRDGGWCALVHHAGTELPAAPLVALPHLPSIDDASLDPDLEDDITAWGDPVHDETVRAALPVALPATPLDRALGAAAVLASLGLGLWVLGWEEASWWQGIGLAATSLSGVHWGTARAVSSVRVERDGIQLVDAWWRERVPMTSVSTVRVADREVLLEVGQGDDGFGLALGPWPTTEHGPGSDRAPTAASVAAAIEDLRALAGTPAATGAEAADRRLSVGAFVLGVAGAALLVRYLLVFLL